MTNDNIKDEKVENINVDTRQILTSDNKDILDNNLLVEVLHVKRNYVIFLFVIIALILSSILASIYIAVTGVVSLEIIIKEDETEIKEEWNIFGKGPNNKVIYPGKSGYFKFDISNECKKNINVTIEFGDDNPFYVPIVYRLYTNDTDLCGSKDNWVTIEELRSSNIIIEPNDELSVTLEWKWASTNYEFDTMIGSEENAYYMIKVSVRGRLN